MIDCPVIASPDTFRYGRIERPDDVPPADARAIDVAILDMNHGWPNLGHDSLVHAVRDAACDLAEAILGSGLYLRALSYDVRRSGVLPDPPGPRFSVYVGTGGPGHIDPRKNDGFSNGSQGIREDPFWEAPLFHLFDSVLANEGAALLAVCHTFGVLCRWSGVAAPVLRGPEKGGKSSGIRENILSLEAERHPWFQKFSRGLPDGRRLRIVDNRLFDLIPERSVFPEGILPLSYETRSLGGPPGDALTMLEFARDREGTMPRILAVNHHPEIVDRRQQISILEQKWARGEVSRDWYEERAELLTQPFVGEEVEARIHHTATYTLHGPLRFHIYRQVRLRAEALGIPVDVDESSVIHEAA